MMRSFNLLSKSKAHKLPFLLLMLALTFVVTPVAASAASTINGTVIDDRTGEALPGTNVFIKGTSIGAAAGTDGSYTITNVPPGTHILTASFIGYHAEEKQVTVATDEVININFTMEEDVFRGEEVVVTGIASKTSKAVAEVAVSRVNASSYTVANTYQSTQQLINGKIAGVNVRSSSGNAGSGFRFSVRSTGGLNGNEQPVIYVDGVRVENSEVGGPQANADGFGVGGQAVGILADLNPEEIENIEVLKGPAAAASYGTSGANGVILITTKKGRLAAGSARNMNVDYKVVRGWNTQSFQYSTDDYLTAGDANTILHTGNVIQNSISATGGTNILRYFASFDSRIEDGITNNNALNRKNLRANFDVVPNDKLTFRVNASYAYNDIQRPNNDNNIFGYLGNTLLASFPYAFTDSTAIEAIDDKTLSNRFIGSLQTEWTPFNGFTGRMTLGIDDQDVRQNQTFPVNENYGVAQNDAGQRSIFTRETRLFTYNLDGRYSFNPGSNLNLSAVAGVQIFDRKRSTFFTQKFDFLSELITNIGSGKELSLADEDFSHRREAGIFSEASLAYSDQYFFSLGLRRDYASVVGQQAPSIFYPKASLALRMDKYHWFPGMFSLMKFRAAYGETGVLPDLLDGIPLLYQAEPGGAGVGGVVGQIGNSEIKPERVKELEVGFDSEFLNNYALEFSYYRQKAEDSIINFLNSPSTGKTATAVPINIGETGGWGFETLLQASPIRARNFGLDLTLINNYQQNEVKSLGGGQPIFDAFDLNVIKEGLPKHEFYTHKILGAEFDEKGVYVGPIVTDQDITDRETLDRFGFTDLDTLKAQRFAFGNPVPDYTGSFSLNLRLLKNVNLYLLTDWATGQKLFNETNQFAYRFGNNPRFNELATQLGIAGTGVAFFSAPVEGVEELTPGTPEYMAAADEFARLDWRYNANFIEDANFFKLREISISYSLRDILPKLFGANFYLRDLVIAFSATNIWTATNYSGPDPEVNFRGARDLTRGQDFLTLMNPRTYNLSFRFSL